MSDPVDPIHGLVHYPFMLRPGQVVFLNLPPDLTLRDVARLTAFLETLVVAPEPDAASGVNKFG